MVSKKKIHLVTGGSYFRRQSAISQIKKDIFKESSALSFFSFYARELDVDLLQETILTVSFQEKKIILIKDFTYLENPVKDFLEKNLSRILKINYLILESEIPYSQLAAKKKILNDSFFNSIFKQAVKYQANPESKVSLEDFCQKLYRNDFKSCFAIADELLSKQGTDKGVAVKILGMVTSKIARLSDSETKKEKLNYLWETDRALKASNIDARVLVGKLIVNLMG